MQGKVNIKTAGGAFLALLLVLIFFSKTIYTYNLPDVTATRPQAGKLNKSETVTGLADWENIEEIYAEVSGKVAGIHVKEGEFVPEGQPMIRLSFDEEEARAKLKEIAVNKSKLAVEMETIQKKLEKTNLAIADLEAETYDPDTVSDYELTQLDIKIQRAEEEADKQKFLYTNGVAAKAARDAAVNELQSLYNQRENLVKTMAEEEADAAEDLADKEKNRATLLRDYRHEAEALRQDLKGKSLDVSSLTISEERIHKTLSDYDRNLIIAAPRDLTVISSPLKNGQYVSENQMMLSYGVGSEFIVECDVSLDNNFIMAGDLCELSNTSHTLEGVVTKIAPAERAKRVTVAVSAEELTAGETFELLFEKRSASEYTLVPNGAVNRDSDGYFLYRVKRRDGLLGKEFYAEKAPVYIGDSDNEYTAITKGIMFFDPIALYGDKPFSDGDTVTVKNEGDFFAD